VLRDRTYALLALSELTVLVCLAICFGVIAFHTERSIDRILSRPEGISRAELERALIDRDREIARLQRLTHTLVFEEDQD
jgi:hypothetical protein